MKVLHIVGNLSCGGVGAFLMNNYRNIDRAKVQFDFLVHNKEVQYYEQEINKLGGTVYKTVSKGANIIRNVYETMKYIKLSKCDVVHIHTASTTSCINLLLAKISGKKVRIVHSHGTNLEKEQGSFQHKIHKILMPMMNKLATHKFACSKAAGKWLFGDNENVIVINNAIDSDKFKYDKEEAERLKSNMNLSKKNVIGFVGRFSDQKNPLFLIDICNEIIKSIPNSIFLLVGDGELEVEMKNKISQLGIDEYFRFLGKRDDINSLMQVMDVMLLPSKFEGLPVVVIEAQASGLPCVISNNITKEVDITGLVEFVGLDESLEIWSQKVKECLKKNRIDTQNKIIESKYDIKHNVKEIEMYYI